VVDALAQVALAQLLADQSHHHGADPLFPDDGVLGGLEGLVVVVVDPVEGGGDLRLLSLEHLGFGGRHCGGLLSESTAVGEKGCGGGLRSIGRRTMLGFVVVMVLHDVASNQQLLLLLSHAELNCGLDAQA